MEGNDLAVLLGPRVPIIVAGSRDEAQVRKALAVAGAPFASPSAAAAGAGVCALPDFPPSLRGPTIVRLRKDVAQDHERCAPTVVLA